LFDATADVRAFDDADRLALGSDSRLSGEGDLLDELKVAHTTRQLSAEGLARIVTTGAAQLLRLQTGGRLIVGAPADVAVVRPLATCPFDTLVAAARTDVRLTLVDGQPVVAEPSLLPIFKAAGVATAPARLDGTSRVVARWVARHVSRMRLHEPGFEVH
jgi:cytosine/adenosine deaminase-related metal-dependent hydrolase